MSAQYHKFSEESTSPPPSYTSAFLEASHNRTPQPDRSASYTLGSPGLPEASPPYKGKRPRMRNPFDRWSRSGRSSATDNPTGSSSTISSILTPPTTPGTTPQINPTSHMNPLMGTVPVPYANPTLYTNPAQHVNPVVHTNPVPQPNTLPIRHRVVTLTSGDEPVQKVSPLQVRKLNELIRKRYLLDIRIWNKRSCYEFDRPNVKVLMRQADAILLQIKSTVESWDNNQAWDSAVDWQKLKDIKQKLEMDGKRLWAEHPPWEEQAEDTLEFGPAELP